YCTNAISSFRYPASNSEEMLKVHAEIANLRARSEATSQVAVSALRVANGDQRAPKEPREIRPEVSQDSTGSASQRTAISDDELYTKLERRFSSEAPDPSWSVPASTLLNEHIHAGLPAGSQISSIECHRTMCRVEAQHSSLDIYNRFVSNAL